MPRRVRAVMPGEGVQIAFGIDSPGDLLALRAQHTGRSRRWNRSAVRKDTRMSQSVADGRRTLRLQSRTPSRRVR